jgi:hypothetical protein
MLSMIASLLLRQGCPCLGMSVRPTPAAGLDARQREMGNLRALQQNRWRAGKDERANCYYL